MTASRIRFYEKHGLVKGPKRSPNGYRAYGDTNIERLLAIRLCQELGLSLQEIKLFLPADPAELLSCEYVLEALKERLRAVDKHLAAMRDQKRQLQKMIHYFEVEKPDGEHANITFLMSKVNK